MKKQILQKMRSKTVAELIEELQQEKNKLTDSKMQIALGKLKNIREVKLRKRDLAQILTIIREKQISHEED